MTLILVFGIAGILAVAGCVHGLARRSAAQVVDVRRSRGTFVEEGSPEADDSIQIYQNASDQMRFQGVYSGRGL